MSERRIIDYDAFNDLPPNSWLIVDSEGQGTGKIAPIKIGATYEIQDGAHSFTLVGSNGYTHTVDIPYDSVQMAYADYQALSEVQKMDGTNRFVPDVPTDDLEPEIWQRVGRTPLTTDAKTISPAINELKGRIDDSDSEIEGIKSNLTELEPTSYSTQGLSSINATIDGGGYFKIGKVVFVNILITATSNIGNWTDIITGFPNPLIENITLITTNISNTDRQPTNFHLISKNNAGAIATMSSGSAVSSGYKYSITGHYLTN